MSAADHIEVPLTKGYVAIVDAADAWVLQWKWYPAKKGGDLVYARRATWTDGRRSSVCLHREILGDSAAGGIVDHIDGDGLNNRRENLRVVSHTTNSRNIIGSKRADKAGSNIAGVFQQREGRWYALINDGGKLIYLGTYFTPEAAAVARAREEVRRWGIEPRRREELERWLSSGIDPEEFRAPTRNTRSRSHRAGAAS